MKPAVDAAGDPILDSEGKATFKLGETDIQPYVVNVVSGVEKMFLIYESKKVSVAATSSGMAAIKGQSVKALANEFRTQNNPNFKTVEEVANAFLVYVREIYVEEYAESAVPEKYRSDLKFLVAGTCNSELYASLFRVSVKENQVVPAFDEDNRTGLFWEGQADGIERLIGGFDSQLRRKIEKNLDDYCGSLHRDWSTRVANIVAELSERAGLDELPDDIDLTLPPAPEFKPPWLSSQVQVQYSSLPLQYAIDFVGFLVTAQSGLQRFTSSIATVGGRTHIGIIRKGYNFLMVDELVPSHRMIGFSDDA